MAICLTMAAYECKGLNLVTKNVLVNYVTNMILHYYQNIGFMKETTALTENFLVCTRSYTISGMDTFVVQLSTADLLVGAQFYGKIIWPYLLFL